MIEMRKKQAKAVNLELTGEYLGAIKKTEYRCPVHGIILQIPNKVQQGFGCQQCGRERQHLSRRADISQIQAQAKKVGLKYVSGFINMNSKTVYECKVHGLISMNPSTVSSGRRCKKCSLIISGGKKKDASEIEVIEAAKKLGITLVGEYKGMRKLADFSCPKHGITRKTPMGVMVGHGCSSCAKYGFDPKREAYFYIYEVTGKENFTGFGITFNLKSRNNNHQLLFKKSMLKGDLVFSVKFEVGSDAKALEDKIKKLYKDFSLSPNVNGFRTEAVSSNKLSSVKKYAARYFSKLK